MENLQTNKFWKDTNSRDFFRLTYPMVDRPKLTVGEREYEVAEIAENTISFFKLDEDDAGNEQDINAVIKFHDNDRTHIAGKVIKTDGKKVVIKFHGGVSFRRMMKEQQNLITKYSGRRLG